jgi:hypothetical protein
MKRISTKLFYSDNREELLNSSTDIMVKIYRGLLGREPNKSDAGRLETRTNPDDVNVNDIYFDNRKVGSLTTSFIPGSKPVASGWNLYLCSNSIKL